MKLLISWIAYNNDFKEGAVNESGPTYNYHHYFFEDEKYDKHILLAKESSENQRITRLTSKIEQDFPERSIEPKILKIEEPIDLKEIKTKVESILLQHSDDEIDIFFSPGTSAMQLAWYICHTTLGLKSRLIQRSEEHTSELQSRFDLVCRHLLEKKKKTNKKNQKNKQIQILSSLY